ncbi:MAG: ShlB/FhaC/HecB family hemolysin secretion/activation protein [Leptolyngbyaceae cyanobacterium CSU_1_3]|nr:ShlB/FhaC/HecB family hemolysin secretion/activation protein [Leptolyngbyaceae cyanobacterium CSU_1_3]
MPIVPPPDPIEPAPDLPNIFKVRRFRVEGSRVFSDAEIDAVTQPFLNRSITFAEVLQARSAIVDLYLQKGYITTGAFVPEQEFTDGGEVTVQVIEGTIAAINVAGTRRLNPNYIRRRIAIAATPPLNQKRLLDGLQLLRLNPLIANLSAELSASPRPGQSILNVTIQEAPSLQGQLRFDNGRSPSVGSDRRSIQLSEGNVLGLGDTISLGYTSTNGSNAWDIGYTLPITPHNTTLSFNYGLTKSNVIEEPFDLLDIESKSRYYELTLRHPLQQTITSEVAIGLTFSRRESETSIGFENIGPFPLSPGADEQGRTRVSALRFFQEWTQRSSRSVFAVRSQFSLGLDALGATINSIAPDSRFFAWRGQAQWVTLLGNSPDSLMLLRADMQFADRPLLPVEQFGIGGFDSVRGYRQDTLLTDNGLFASAEARIPLLRIPNWDSTISLTPFLELGQGWNRDRPDPDPKFLISTGLGLRWRVGDRFIARVSWGIPLVSIESEKRTLQEKGVYFSVLWNPF